MQGINDPSSKRPLAIQCLSTLQPHSSFAIRVIASLCCEVHTRSYIPSALVEARHGLHFCLQIVFLPSFPSFYSLSRKLRNSFSVMLSRTGIRKTRPKRIRSTGIRGLGWYGEEPKGNDQQMKTSESHGQDHVIRRRIGLQKWYDETGT